MPLLLSANERGSSNVNPFSIGKRARGYLSGKVSFEYFGRPVSEPALFGTAFLDSSAVVFHWDITHVSAVTASLRQATSMLHNYAKKASAIGTSDRYVSIRLILSSCKEHTVAKCSSSTRSPRFAVLLSESAKPNCP
jgi:hypothetical protein